MNSTARRAYHGETGREATAGEYGSKKGRAAYHGETGREATAEGRNDRVDSRTPVILDDALVYSDDDRIEKMFDALHRQASAQQVIVFSCRQCAFARLGGHVLRTEPWQPDS